MGFWVSSILVFQQAFDGNVVLVQRNQAVPLLHRVLALCIKDFAIPDPKTFLTLTSSRSGFYELGILLTYFEVLI